MAIRRPKPWFWRLVTVGLLISAIFRSDPVSSSERILLFAAASTGDPLQRIAALASRQGAPEIVLVLGASSTLARQIEAGAPAGLFLSANETWMDHLSQSGAIADDSRAALLSNRIALVGGSESVSDMTVQMLAEHQDAGRIAIGDPDHVPVGRYAKAAMQTLGLWPMMRGRLAAASDARAAIQLTATGQTQYGIAYRTDARLSDRVSVLELLPEDSHPPIRYVIAVVARSDGPEARRALAFITSKTAAREFERSGFTVLTRSD